MGVFFFKQKTAYEMRISDGSSDVCSSDLTVLAALFAPALAKLFGWNAVLGLACIPLTIVFFIYLVMAKDAPNAPAPKKLVDYFQPLKTADAWWLMAFYSVTFGGFVGLAASLPIYFTDPFHLTPVMAGYFPAACVFAGSDRKGTRLNS